MEADMSYVRVVNGRVYEVIAPLLRDDGTEIPLVERFSSEIVAQMVDVSGIQPAPVQGDVAAEEDGTWTFTAYVEPAPSPEQIRAANAMQRDLLLKVADTAVAPLQDAVDLQIATAGEQALLTKWKQYRVAVNRIDLTQLHPTWPAPPVPPDYVTAPGAAASA
jgi:hypothetical protein